jgi:hypothetical protein
MDILLSKFGSEKRLCCMNDILCRRKVCIVTSKLQWRETFLYLESFSEFLQCITVIKHNNYYIGLYWMHIEWNVFWKIQVLFFSSSCIFIKGSDISFR